MMEKYISMIQINSAYSVLSIVTALQTRSEVDSWSEKEERIVGKKKKKRKIKKGSCSQRSQSLFLLLS